jgi:hypothetical protein
MKKQTIALYDILADTEALVALLERAYEQFPSGDPDQQFIILLREVAKCCDDYANWYEALEIQPRSLGVPRAPVALLDLLELTIENLQGGDDNNPEDPDHQLVRLLRMTAKRCDEYEEKMFSTEPVCAPTDPFIIDELYKREEDDKED